MASSCNEKQLNLSELELINLDGEPVLLSDYKNKTLFLNFWATWCKPCLEEFPSIVNAKSKLEPEGLQFLFISDEPLSVIQSFKAKKPYNFTYLKSTKAIAELGIYSLPETYIVGKNGKITGSMSGGYRWDTPGNLKLLGDFLK